jgi:hypothetical protein
MVLIRPATVSSNKMVSTSLNIESMDRCPL